MKQLILKIKYLISRLDSSDPEEYGAIQAFEMVICDLIPQCTFDDFNDINLKLAELEGLILLSEEKGGEGDNWKNEN